MITVEDLDRNETPTARKKYDEVFEFGNSPFHCACAGKIDGKMTGAFNFKSTLIGPQNKLEDHIRYKLTCKVFDHMRKMQKRVDARKGKSMGQLREQRAAQRESFIS